MTEDRFAVYIDQFELEAEWSIVPGDSGMNNTTRMIQAGNRRYVLREYNNHRDRGTVRLEHELLQALQKLDKPFQSPVPVAKRNGDTIAESPDGTLAALYIFIEGSRPNADNKAHIRSLGRAVADLMLALGRVSVSYSGPYSPYYEIEQVYGELTTDVLKSLAERHPQIQTVEVKLLELQKLREQSRDGWEHLKLLPRQWIHGDVNFSNAVAIGDEVVGLLDFEFCTVDVRAMELAVVITDLIAEEDQLAWEQVRCFCDGFCGSLHLTEQEMMAVPTLIKLRMLDVLLHFATRLEGRLDDASVLAGIIEQCHRICSWTGGHERELQQLFLNTLVRQT
ncbi:phosphotransferase [Paenibacillus gorillae]|uniref:phosphotransferase n=1 Tax=Paenibacillus gorillae TaxID=1243662 RepID=UPI0004B4052F|nr:phosphotransferase [Paenibacillus gorillae]